MLDDLNPEVGHAGPKDLTQSTAFFIRSSSCGVRCHRRPANCRVFIHVWWRKGLTQPSAGAARRALIGSEPCQSHSSPSPPTT
jgi:hypothetical protein